MLSLEERVVKLRKEVSSLKAALARETGQLEAYKKQRELLMEKCREKGYDPDQLPELISQTEAKLTALAQAAEQRLAAVDEERRKILVCISQ